MGRGQDGGIMEPVYNGVADALRRPLLVVLDSLEPSVFILGFTEY